MSSSDPGTNASRGLNLALSRLLRVGLVTSLLLLLVGVGLAVAGQGTPVPRHTSFTDIPGALYRLEAGGFFSLGLLVLLLTPAAQVLALSVAFIHNRQWLFTFFTLIVLAVIVLSGVLGLNG